MKQWGNWAVLVEARKTSWFYVFLFSSVLQGFWWRDYLILDDPNYQNFRNKSILQDAVEKGTLFPTPGILLQCFASFCLDFPCHLFHHRPAFQTQKAEEIADFCSCSQIAFSSSILRIKVMGKDWALPLGLDTGQGIFLVSWVWGHEEHGRAQGLRWRSWWRIGDVQCGAEEAWGCSLGVSTGSAWTMAWEIWKRRKGRLLSQDPGLMKTVLVSVLL